MIKIDKLIERLAMSLLFDLYHLTKEAIYPPKGFSSTGKLDYMESKNKEFMGHVHGK